MHITLESDYALRIVFCLLQRGERTDAGRIAEETGVTLRFALKILRKLVSAGLICSFKGAQGGYEPARPASEISMKDVIEAIEGVYCLNRCLDPEIGCTRNMTGCCPIHQAFGRISGTVRRMLAEETFDKLLTADCKETGES